MNHNGITMMKTMRSYERIGMLVVADPNYVPNPQDPASSARSWMDQYRDQQAVSGGISQDEVIEDEGKGTKCC